MLGPMPAGAWPSRAAGRSPGRFPGGGRRVRAAAWVLWGALVAGLLPAGGCGDSTGGDGHLNARAVFGEVGLSPGQFSYPRALAVAQTLDGLSVFVCDKTARIQRIDPATGRCIGALRTPEWALGKPTGLTIGPHPADPARTMLWVADTHYHRVLLYELPGQGTQSAEPTEPVLSFGSYGTDPGQFIYPTDVALLTDADGRVTRAYVSEYGGNDRITAWRVSAAGDSVRFEPEFTIGVFGAPEEAPEGGVAFNRPQSLAIDRAAQELVVVDACNHRLVRLGLDGSVVASIGQPGDGPGAFNYPYSVALLEDGTALVCEFGACRVQQIDLGTGAGVRSFGGPGFGEGSLAKPWAVAVWGRRAFVLDSGRNRVVEFASPAVGGVVRAD